MYTDHQVRGRITMRRAKEGLNSLFEIGISRMPLEPPIGLQNKGASTHARLTLVLDGNGHPWLLSTSDTLDLKGGVPHEQTEQLLEAAGESDLQKIYDLGTCLLSFWWGVKDCKLTRLQVTRSNLDSLWRWVGVPTGDGEWVARRLLPRVVGGALRLFDDGALQLWIKL